MHLKITKKEDGEKRGITSREKKEEQTTLFSRKGEKGTMAGQATGYLERGEKDTGALFKEALRTNLTLRLLLKWRESTTVKSPSTSKRSGSNYLSSPCRE